MPSLSADTIYERILPTIFNTHGGADEAERIDRCFSEIPNSVAKMRDEINAWHKKPAACAEALAAFNDNLIRVAIRMIRNDAKNVVVAGGGIRLAAFAVHFGADPQWAEEKVFEPYGALWGQKIPALAQDKIKSGRNSLRSDYNIIVKDIMLAAGLVPPSRATALIRGRAEKCLVSIANENPNEYHNMVKRFAMLCRHPNDFPGALPVVEKSFDLFGTQLDISFDSVKEQKPGHERTQQLVDTATFCLSFDAIFIASLNDLPSLDQRATDAFCKHYKILKDASGPEASECLEKLASVYAETEDLDPTAQEGHAKVRVLVEYFQTAHTLTEPLDNPTHLFKYAPTPKTRLLEPTN